MHRSVDEDTTRLLGSLLEISYLVGSVMQIDLIFDKIVEIAADLMQAPVCSIYLINDDGTRLVMRSNIGFEEDLLGKADFAIGEGIPGWVAEHGELVALNDASQDERYKPLASALELKCQAYICTPLRIQNEVIGVMTARKTECYEFTQQDCLFFETVAKQVSIVIEKGRMYNEKIAAERLAAVAVSLSGVAHYIKNILTSMRGSEYMLEQGLIEERDHAFLRQGWKILKRSNRKIRELVENMLNYCRKTEPDREPININRMIVEIIEATAETAAQKGVEIMHELSGEMGQVLLEPTSIYDALLNLISNGIDAIGEDARGRVIVRSEWLEDQNLVRVDVLDNGCGIPEEAQEKIYNLFFSTKGQKGTGIGLAATRKIIEDHHGTIEFTTEIGKGTQFSVYLPITPPESDALSEIGISSGSNGDAA